MGVTASRTLSVAGPADLSDVTFRLVEQSRYPEILELLYSNFHTDEPMSRAIQIYDGSHRVPAVDEYTLTALEENLSIMAIDSITNKLLGVAINGQTMRESYRTPLENKIKDIRNDKFKHIISVLHEVNRRGEKDVFKHLGNVEKIFDIKMVTTDKHNRRGGLGTDLLRRSVDLATKMGYEGCKTEATGIYSRRAFERLGFTVIAEFPYSDYEGDDGERVFSNMEQHKCVTLLIKKIHQKDGSIDEEDKDDN